MPSNETAKTKSAPKAPTRRKLLVIGILVVLVAAATVFVIRIETDKTVTLAVDGASNGQTGLRTMAHGKLYKLKPAISAADQQKGLGGISSLPADHGMLFPYQEAAERCFWMKDMQFALDILWLNAKKQVVHLEKSVAPSTYPKLYCADAQYVVELNAGEADKSGITSGETLSF